MQIVIQQEHDVKPLHIIEHHKKPSTKQLDAKASIADLKRKESLNKMKQQHQQKKSAIQQALSSTEAPSAKRIKFSDAEEDDEVEPKEVQNKPKGRDLFDDEDGEEQDQEQEFVLPQYSGKKGERLVEMQSKQSLDPRFRITANFVGEEDDDKEQADETEQSENPKDNERDWQMGILEQVIGRKIDTANATAAKAAKNKKMLRYDPAKDEHQKLVRVKDKDKVKQQPKQKDEKVHTEEEGAGPTPVSQSAFYVVTDTLKQSLKTRGEGFSLLEMFGSSHEEAVAQRQDQLEKISHEKILVNKSNKLGLGQVNPFSYDSSDSEDEEQQQQQEKEKEPPQVAKENEKPNKQKQKKAQIFIESFFIPKNDVRLKGMHQKRIKCAICISFYVFTPLTEGAKFFKSSKAELENDNYDEVKKRLKFLITKKIAKTQKNQPGKIVKKNKNKKRNKF